MGHQYRQREVVREGQRLRALLAATTLAPMWLDVLVTLRGQAIGYWMGFYELAYEYNPIGRIALEAHPLVFLAMMGVWATIVALAIGYSPTRVAATVAALVSLGHLWGLANWLLAKAPFGALVLAAFLIILAIAWLCGLFLPSARQQQAAGVALMLGAGLVAGACLPKWEPALYDDACAAALFEVDRGAPERGEVLVTAAYLHALDTPPGSSERCVAEAGLATFYDRIGRRREAAEFARAAVATASVGTLDPTVEEVTRRMFADLLVEEAGARRP